MNRSFFKNALFLLVIYTGLRWLFYLYNRTLFPQVALSDGLPMLLQGGLIFDLSGLLMLNLPYIILALFPHPWQNRPGYQKATGTLFVILNSLGLGINLIDIAYYPFTLRRMTWNVLLGLRSEGHLFWAIPQFLWDYGFLFVLWLILSAGLCYFAFWAPRSSQRLSWKQIPFFLLICGLSVAGIRGGFDRTTRPIAMSNGGQYTKNPEEVPLVLNSTFTLLRTLENTPLMPLSFFKTEEELRKAFDPIKPPSMKPFTPKNVVFVILESFTREAVWGKGFTPFLDGLTEKSLSFPNAFANGRKSIDAMPSIIASLPSLATPYIVSDYGANRIRSLGQILSDKGYGTSFFHGAPNGSMGFLAFSQLAGIQNYYGKTEFGDDRFDDGFWGIWDGPFFQFWAKHLESFQEPFFSICFSLSSHHPFAVPKEYEGVLPEGPIPLYRGIAYTDQALKEFFRTVEKAPWYGNTLFVITADHSFAPVSPEFQTSVMNFAIPILFFTPDGSLAPKKDPRLIQQIDIMPTVLSYLGYDKPHLAFGTDRLSQDSSLVFQSLGEGYQFILDEEWVLYWDGQRVTHVFHWSQDPFLQENLLGKRDSKAWETRIKGFMEQYHNRMIRNDLTIKVDSSQP
jgi:phosphoglycerol transferase MdoB-like AlkP superfamily enzyme